MKIRLIAEGSTKRERKVLRWGISFLIDDVLFDAFGRSDIFWKNIRRFKIDPSRVKHIVISHEDWDHIAGLETFLQKYPKTRVYVCERTGKDLKSLLRQKDAVPVMIKNARKIRTDIFSLGQMRADTGRGILYEQSLVVRSRNGFSVITGCAHPGIVRIVRRATKIFGRKIYAVCGGFHMKDNTPEENKKILEELESLGVKKVIPLHCTGRDAFRLFQKIYRRSCLSLSEGQTITL